MKRLEEAHVAAVAVVLLAIVFRGVVSFDPFPGWSDDPTRLPAVFAAMGPRESLVVDMVMACASAAAIVLGARRGLTTNPVLMGLALLGSAGALLHGLVWRADSVDDLTIAMNWIAAMCAGLALHAAASDARMKRLSAAVLVGLVGLLVTKGAAQVFVEQPSAYKDFLANKGAILDAHGWSENSPLARSFERRISQADAVGWYGLSNVYGSVAGACAVVLAGCVVGAWWSGRRRLASLLVLPTTAAAAALAFSMSKGAMVAAGCGAMLGAIGLFIWVRSKQPMPRRWLGLAGLACVVMPLAAVALRGAIGERIGELSLLFRWFYAVGAARIFTEHPGVGVGPGGFQDAYMLAKPALSPENVTSPHSVLLDYAATLGTFGLAWCAVLIALVWKCGAALLEGPGDEPLPTAARSVAESENPGGMTPREEARLAIAILCLASLGAAFVEHETASIQGTTARLVGMLLGGVAAYMVLRAGRECAAPLRVSLAAAGLALVVHAQIEMTGVSPGSAAWWMAFVAIAGSRVTPAGGEASERTRPCGWIVAGAAVLVAMIGIAVPSVLKVWRWQAELHAGALDVRPLAFVDAMMTNTTLGPERDRLEVAAQILSEAVGHRVAGSRSALAEAALLARQSLVERAIPRLARAAEFMPRHFGTHRAGSELNLGYATFVAVTGRPDRAKALQATSERIIEDYVKREPRRASGWAWQGVLYRTLAKSGLADGAWERMADSLERASELDPYGIVNIPGLVEACMVSGQTDRARRWAAEGLRRNALTRLDPLAGLGEEQVRRLTEVAAGSP